MFSSLIIAALTIVQPKANETVPQLWPSQKYYFELPREERHEFNWQPKSAEMKKKLRKVKGSAKPVEIRWQGANGEAEVSVCRLPDKKEFFRAKTSGEFVAITGRLEVARTWLATVTDSTGAKSEVEFATEAYAPRIIKLQGTGNVRDIGGWVGLNGRRVKQGLVFRSQGLNNNAKTTYYTYDEIMKLHKEGKLAAAGPQRSRHIALDYERKLSAGKKLDKNFLRLFKTGPTEFGKVRITEADKDYLLNFIGIKTDLDFRGDWECWGMVGSPLGDSVAWIHREYLAAYSCIDLPLGRVSAAQSLAVFMKRENYPILFHCIGGADRTGTWAYLLGAFLGVDEEDLIRDYQTTFLGGGGPDKRHASWLASLIKAVKLLPGETLAEKLRTYFISLGFKPQEVDELREFLLEKAS